ncbi:hypothetical protein BVRB_9g213470 [Beta vulgaris subsp. vulgaris]|nr:hypothetical protein BVRB_9g213470 [Beta vulgaris subsp. vulgaris]
MTLDIGGTQSYGEPSYWDKSTMLRIPSTFGKVKKDLSMAFPYMHIGNKEFHWCSFGRAERYRRIICNESNG